jgi:hypothetical protein
MQEAEKDESDIPIRTRTGKQGGTNADRLPDDPAFATAIQTAFSHSANGDAGPKQMLTIVQSANPAWGNVGLQKFKRLLAKIKLLMKDEAVAK